MNAYELADIIEEDMEDGFGMGFLKDAVSMIRKQADRIAELEKEADRLSNHANELRKIHANRIAELEKDLALKTRDRDVFRDFTLAYEKRIEELEKLEQDFIRVIKQTNPNKPQTKQSEPVAWMSPDGKVSTTEGMLFHIPLYTTPQTKPLSDEEIWALSEEFVREKQNILLFARAIEERHGIK
jgi:hypothetical protein